MYKVQFYSETANKWVPSVYCSDIYSSLEEAEKKLMGMMPSCRGKLTYRIVTKENLVVKTITPEMHTLKVTTSYEGPTTGIFKVGYLSAIDFWEHSEQYPKLYIYVEAASIVLDSSQGVFPASTEFPTKDKPLWTSVNRPSVPALQLANVVNTLVGNWGSAVNTGFITFSNLSNLPYNGQYTQVPPGYKLVKEEEAKPEIKPPRTLVQPQGRKFR